MDMILLLMNWKPVVAEFSEAVFLSDGTRFKGVAQCVLINGFNQVVFQSEFCFEVTSLVGGIVCPSNFGSTICGSQKAIYDQRCDISFCE